MRKSRRAFKNSNNPKFKSFRKAWRVSSRRKSTCGINWKRPRMIFRSKGHPVRTFRMKSRSWKHKSKPSIRKMRMWKERCWLWKTKMGFFKNTNNKKLTKMNHSSTKIKNWKAPSINWSKTSPKWMTSKLNSRRRTWKSHLLKRILISSNPRDKRFPNLK